MQVISGWLIGPAVQQRLTTSPAREVYPTFSPDGSQVAFARFNPTTGPFGWDVYVASASGGEERRVTYHPDLDFPVNWTRTKIGPVVGTRTGGAGIGATNYQLIDSGSFRVPDWGWYDPRVGTWLMENRGVTPDYELEIMPSAWRAGRDQQLEKAIELAMDTLKKTKTPRSKRPGYPVYK